MQRPQVDIDVAQDGEKISDALINKYGLNKNDLFYSNDGKAYSNFVGMVQRGNDILISIPKHFMDMHSFKKYDDSQKKRYIRLIMDSINESTKGYQNSDYQPKDTDNTTLALAAYFRVYDYFAKYGLYHEEHQEIKPTNGNKISWKDTLHRSTKFITNGNLIFSPLFYKKKATDETIVTDCMIFVINYTSQLLGEFMTLPSNSRIADRGLKSGILGNKAVIYKLQEILSRTFKDINQQLIRNIVLFLRQVNSLPWQVPDIKYYSYSSVWEQAVQKYLDSHFKGIDGSKKAIFTPGQTATNIFEKKPIYYNTVKKHQGWYLEPDHILRDDNKKRIYVFDSKYYRNLTDLNHKQFVYHVLLSNKYSEYDIFDSLVVPSENHTKTEEYVNIDSKYLLSDETPITIYLTRLNMIEVLRNYVN